MTTLERSSAALGRAVSRFAALGVFAGVFAFVTGVVSGLEGPALAALCASWLFCSGLAAGSVALSASIRLAGGRWALPILPIADASVGFFAPALLLLGLIVLGARAFVPWAAAPANPSVVPLGLRLLGATAVLFATGWRFTARARRSEAGAAGSAVAYLILYATTLSLWAFDLVMGLEHAPPSTVIPAYYFLGAFFSGVAWVGLVASARGVAGPDLRHDLGKLIFALILVWSYLLWAAFLPTWYGNVPEEAAPMLARWRSPYRVLTVGVLVAVFAWPFWLLFPEALKRRRATLAMGSGVILLGMLGERFLLVLPALDLPAGWASQAVGAGVTLGVLGVFLLGVGSRLGGVQGLPRRRR